MRWARSLRLRFRTLLRGGRVEQELTDEAVPIADNVLRDAVLGRAVFSPCRRPEGSSTRPAVP